MGLFLALEVGEAIALATTTGMTTPLSICMTISARVAAIVLTLFLDRICAGVHDAEASFTGTFHLSNSRHGKTSSA